MKELRVVLAGKISHLKSYIFVLENQNIILWNIKSYQLIFATINIFKEIG